MKVIYHLNVSENISTNNHWTLREQSVKLFFNDISLTFSSFIFYPVQSFQWIFIEIATKINLVSVDISLKRISTNIHWNLKKVMHFSANIIWNHIYVHRPTDWGGGGEDTDESHCHRTRNPVPSRTCTWAIFWAKKRYLFLFKTFHSSCESLQPTPKSTALWENATRHFSIGIAWNRGYDITGCR